MATERADWLSKAVDLFPDLEERFEHANTTPMSFWIELRFALEMRIQSIPSKKT